MLVWYSNEVSIHRLSQSHISAKHMKDLNGFRYEIRKNLPHSKIAEQIYLKTY